MPRATLIAELVGSLLMVALAGLGVLDGAIPKLIRVEVIPVSIFALAVLALAHHSTLQAAQAVTAAAAQVGQVAADAGRTIPGLPAWLPTAGQDVAQVMAGVGAAIESSRQGVLALAPAPAPAADSGRHQAAEAPTADLSSYPPPVPSSVLGG